MAYFAERLECRLSLRTLDDLLVDATTDADDPILASFFEGYDRAFVLANEKEELEGFRTCMPSNRPPAIPSRAIRSVPGSGAGRDRPHDRYTPRQC